MALDDDVLEAIAQYGGERLLVLLGRLDYLRNKSVNAVEGGLVPALEHDAPHSLLITLVIPLQRLQRGQPRARLLQPSFQMLDSFFLLVASRAPRAERLGDIAALAGHVAGALGGARAGGLPLAAF